LTPITVTGAISSFFDEYLHLYS